MLNRKYLILILCVLLLNSCKNEPKANAAIVELEKTLATAPDNEKAKQLIALYSEAAKTDSASQEAPLMLYKAAELARTIGEQGTALDYYERIYANYKNFDKRSNCLFLKAFTLEEILDTANARVTYEQFIKEFPTHELVESAQFSLKNLGISPEELIKSFEAKQKK